MATLLLLGIPSGALARSTGWFPGWYSSWTTYHHDAGRSGIDPELLMPVAPTQRWQSAALDGEVYAEPLILGNRVYVATENDTVYALDASTGAIVWQTHVANAVPTTQLSCPVITPIVGITSTPVIDPRTQRIYVVANTWDGIDRSSIAHEMFALNLSSGQVELGPVDVDPPNAPAADTPRYQLQRPGLALDGGRVIIGYAGYTDCGPYHGWLVSVSEDGRGPVRSFETESQSGDTGGGFWDSGEAPVIDFRGDVWVANGNGDSGTTFDFADSVMKLDPDMNLLDWWAPSNWYYLDVGNPGGFDLGTEMPLLLPGGLVFEVGKQGIGYLLSQANLGHTGAPPLFSGNVCRFGTEILYDGVIYVACRGGDLVAETLDTRTDTFAPLPGYTTNPGPNGPPIVAAGTIWAVNYFSGYLYGINPLTGATTFSANLGGVEHFTTPSAAGGLLFVANHDKSAPGSDQVTAFQIGQPPRWPSARSAGRHHRG